MLAPYNSLKWADLDMPFFDGNGPKWKNEPKQYKKNLRAWFDSILSIFVFYLHKSLTRRLIVPFRGLVLC
jgi:hypothetical protein